MRLLVTPTLGALALGAALLVPRTASAGLSSCGNIHVEAQAQVHGGSRTGEVRSAAAPISVRGGVQRQAVRDVQRSVQCQCAGVLHRDVRGNLRGEVPAEPQLQLYGRLPGSSHRPLPGGVFGELPIEPSAKRRAKRRSPESVTPRATGVRWNARGSVKPRARDSARRRPTWTAT